MKTWIFSVWLMTLSGAMSAKTLSCKGDSVQGWHNPGLTITATIVSDLELADFVLIDHGGNNARLAKLAFTPYQRQSLEAKRHRFLFEDQDPQGGHWGNGSMQLTLPTGFSATTGSLKDAVISYGDSETPPMPIQLDCQVSN